MQSQYDRFLSAENFKIAYIRLSTAHKNLYKSLYYEDLKIFGSFLDENIKSVINIIEQGIYSPENCHKFFIPKKGYFVRPLSLLTFIDLLIYQAMVNVIADESYDLVSPYYDTTLFGNIINPTTSNGNDKKFFFKSWKKRWRKFNEISKTHYNNGYIYFSEFDIASFYDTIDHSILCQILSNTFGIEKPLLDLLSKCLEVWTADSNHPTFQSKHGIPQGPISSSLLADLYLFYLDSEIRKLKKLDYKYLRYVDDIRILSKDVLTSQKLIAILDLYSRDLGLIPQPSKILIKEVKDIDKELKVLNTKFSEIVKEYKEENEGKPSRTLKAKTHRQLKKRLLDCFKEKSADEYLDKTIINFALFKLNKDDEIKQLLINNYNLLFGQFEAVLYYLSSNYQSEEDVLNFIKTLIASDEILFHHVIALCFKFFPYMEFDENVYRTYTLEKHRHWLINYYMINWLYKNGKKDLILSTNDSNNHFINRELNYYKFHSSTDSSYRKLFSSRLLESQDPLIALQGLNLLFTSSILFSGYKPANYNNTFIRFINTNQPQDVINYTFKNIWEIDDSELFFNETIWSDVEVYSEAKTCFLLFNKSIDNDPSKALLNLNSFNNLVFDKLCEILNVAKPSSEYGSNLNSGIISNHFPVCNRYWTEINEKRNQKTDAHPYDKAGNIRLRITSKELKDLYIKQKLAIAELSNFKF